MEWRKISWSRKNKNLFEKLYAHICVRIYVHVYFDFLITCLTTGCKVILFDV